MRPSRLWIYRLITALLPETRFFGLKVRLLRWCGAQIGSNVRINSSARFAGDGQLIIGDDVWIGPGNLLSAVGSATLTIGSHCDLAPQVTLLTGTHMVGGGSPSIWPALAVHAQSPLATVAGSAREPSSYPAFPWPSKPSSQQVRL